MAQGTTGFDAHDSAGVAAHAAALVAQGYSFAAQYIDQDPATEDGPPGITPAQVGAARAAGLDLVSIYETAGLSSTDYQTGALSYGWQSYLTEAQGRTDAAEAVASAQKLGQPPGSAIYFAMDFDPAATSGLTEAEALSRVQSYFQGIADDMTTQPAASRYAVGVYGAGDTLDAVVRRAGLATYGWLSLSTGWAGSGAGSPNAQGWGLYQGQGTTASGTAIDPDAASGGIGSWSQGGAATSGGDTAATSVAPTVDPAVAYDGAGTFTLTGTAPGAASVAFSALVDGQSEELGIAMVGADGRFAFADPIGAATQTAITATAAGGGSVGALFDLVGAIAGGHPAGAQVSLDPATGDPALRTFFRGDGSVAAVAALAAGQTVEAPPDAAVLARGRGGGTFAFDPGFGRDSLHGFTASGADHDTLILAGSDFAGIADVLRRTRDVAAGAVIRDPVTGDALLVAGVSAAELRHNPGDIALRN